MPSRVSFELTYFYLLFFRNLSTWEHTLETRDVTVTPHVVPVHLCLVIQYTYHRSNFLYRFNNAFASVTTCGRTFSAAYIWDWVISWLPVLFGVSLPDQSSVSAATGGVPGHVSRQFLQLPFVSTPPDRGFKSLRKPLTELADFIYLLLALDVTQVDYPCLVDHVLCGISYNQLTGFFDWILTRCVFHSRAASAKPCVVIHFVSSMFSASTLNLSLQSTSSARIHLSHCRRTRIYAFICSISAAACPRNSAVSNVNCRLRLAWEALCSFSVVLINALQLPLVCGLTT